MPTVAVLEVRQPYAADLLKRRLFFMEDQALRLSGLEVPDFEKPREPGVPVSEAAWEYGAFIAFCLIFAVSVHAIAEEFAAEVARQGRQSSVASESKTTWYKLTAPPKDEYFEKRLVGTVNELTKWNGLKKPTSLKLKVKKDVLWIMLEPDGRFACYLRTPEQYSTAESRRVALEAEAVKQAKTPTRTRKIKTKTGVSAATKKTKKNQKKPKSPQSKKTRHKTK